MNTNRCTIVGYIDSYGIPECKNWLYSIKKSGFTGNIVLIACRVSSETVGWFKAHGVKVFVHEPMTPLAPVVARFYILWRLLEEKLISEPTYFVMLSDVKDVIFQKNLEDVLSDYDHVVVGTENVRYNDEPWGIDNLAQSFPLMLDTLGNQDICNAGTFTARWSYMRDICKMVFCMSVNSKIHNPDQAALNVVLRNTWFDHHVTYSTVEQDYAIQIGTTFDPRKNLKQIVPLDGIGWDNGGIVHNAKGESYCIVHQYDRNPELKKLIDERYNNE